MTTAHSLKVFRAGDRFHTAIDWLDSWHSFSFGEHYHPDRVGYRSLRVINDDVVAPGRGFATHPHASMEIFTYVISGQLEHRDSMGNGRIISAGEFQYMSAGTGVEHSESNPSPEEKVHLLQIWITPSSPGGEPRYADRDTKPLRQKDALTLLASPTGREGSFAIRQHAEIHFGSLSAGSSLQPGAEYRHHYLHLIKGGLSLCGEGLSPGDGAAVDGEFSIKADEDSEFLLFSLN
ncbi:MAG: pirin family protein [Verrucomicrobiota bacterium JB023]|nr:pirin family protein [Verrucomicrobiota bacterium JB023]